MEILFVSSNGVITTKNQFNLEVEPMVLKERTRVGVEEGSGRLNSHKKEANTLLGSSDCSSKPSWFEQSEQMASKEAFNEVIDDFSSPRSYLKLIDEALEYDLCHMSDRRFVEEEDHMGLTR